MADQPSLNIAPELPISPEEDAKLQAIEAMEAKSVDLDPPQVPVAPPVAPPQPTVVATPTPVVAVQPPQPQTPKTAAEAIAKELENAASGPQHPVFQFFVKQKPSRNTLIFAGVGIGLALLIAIGSFLLIQSV